MPRFVLLTHDHPELHWDLMLEFAGVLRTWRLAAAADSAERIAATPLPDHRLLYLEFEGPISNQRGTVQRWDRGEYEVLQDTADVLEMNWRGERLRGRVTLTTEPDGSVWFQFKSDGEFPILATVESGR